MGKLVVKDNAFLEAGHKLNEVEQQLVLLAIVKAREFCDSVEQLRGKKLSIHTDDYIQTFNTSRDLAYKNLKKAVFGLYEAEWGYRYTNNKGNVVVHRERFTQNAIYVDSEGVVEFVFADAVIPMLVQLEKNFTSYDIEQIAQLSSRYAMRIYEMIMRHFDKKKGSGWIELSLDDFRFRLGILPSEYPRMGNLKARVLDVAINQINERTNIQATYTPKKQGRKIVGFSFKSKYKNNVKKTKDSDSRDTNTLDVLTPISMTDKQRQLFAGKLAELSELGGYAPSGASYQEYAKKIEKELLDPEKAEFYRPYLEQIGFKI